MHGLGLFVRPALVLLHRLFALFAPFLDVFVEILAIAPVLCRRPARILVALAAATGLVVVVMVR